MVSHPLPIYVGFDPREEAGTHVFTSSLIHNASRPVSVIPLHLNLFQAFYGAGHRDGSNAFIYTRFLIPFLEGFKGWALFVDGADMLMRGDISELWALRDHYKAVQVVKHDYQTKHPRKYVGTLMESKNENYERKNWSSVMLINCSHFAWRQMTPEKIQEMTGPELHRFSWIPEDRVGELPPEWNWIADEFGPNPEAKLLHWTAGSPAFLRYRGSPHADEFFEQLKAVNHVTP
jgi:lipopolysaccharide biosynthesis glycosyltransferase